MRPVEIKDGKHDFAKPRNWDNERDGVCRNLPVRDEVRGRHNEHCSNWKPDTEELKLLNNGGVVELCCVGVQPPVSISVVKKYYPPGIGPTREESGWPKDFNPS
jgi:hypothetical protein